MQRLYFTIKITKKLDQALKDKKGDFPVSEKLTDETLSLPMFPELKLNDIKYVYQTSRKFYAN